MVAARKTLVPAAGTEDTLVPVIPSPRRMPIFPDIEEDMSDIEEDMSEDDMPDIEEDEPEEDMPDIEEDMPPPLA